MRDLDHLYVARLLSVDDACIEGKLIAVHQTALRAGRAAIFRQRTCSECGIFPKRGGRFLDAASRGGSVASARDAAQASFGKNYGPAPDSHNGRRRLTAALHSICCFLKVQPYIDIVGTATDGRQALESARVLKPDLVLMDVQMPVMNGIEAAARLRQDLPATRIVLVTVHDNPEVRQACRECGADAFVVKEHMDTEFPRLLRTYFHLLENEEDGNFP